jgi:thiol-disulfide isomerase/thioredoxin
MKKIPVWFGILFLIIAGVLAFNLFGQPIEEQQAKVNPIPVDKSQVQSAPDFTLTDLEGNSVSLTDFKGKNVYLNFWASWCGPCRMEMPDIEKIYQEYKDKDLVVLAVNVGEGQDTVKSFIDTHQLSFPVLLDSKTEAARIYKVSSIPVSIFINKEGIIAAKRVGLMTHEEMEAYVAELYK